jgi:chemotaxis protein CheX
VNLAGTSFPSTAASREDWLPTLVLAMREVFELMLAYSLEIPSVPPQEGLEITSMVGMTGPLCAVLTLRCTTKSAARMASRMLGTDPDQAGEQMWDAVGEICNMVAGNFKNKIHGLGDGCMLSVPTVISGGDYNVHSLVRENLKTAFLFEGEPILVSLEIHS